MSKKHFVQPTGAWGIIMWSIALSLACLGIILQLEIMAFSFIPFLIWIIDAIYIVYIITNSWVSITADEVIVKEPYYKTRRFNHTDVSIKANNKWTLEFNFNSRDFFPFRVTSTKGILNIIKKEAGESNVISK
ncbi:EbsA family protein [Companilactobacillus musae]|uniref:EbsA family protein n=1 Tax=Companilactobacillus musae TaxID=1903258 RepID=UPI000E647471|nr:EbsA family protein [Companilactobacillus musae]